MTLRKTVSTALSFCLLAACDAHLGTQAGSRPGQPGTDGQALSAAGGSVANSALRCRVVFPVPARSRDDGRQVQATAAQTTQKATVALIDTGTGNTLAAGQTDVNGNATLAPNANVSFLVPGGLYYLQVTHRASAAVGSAIVSMASVVEWTSTGWASITNGTGGSGQIVVNPTTTAVVVIQQLDTANTTLLQTIGVVSGPPSYTTVSPFGGAGNNAHSSTDVTPKVTTVTTELTGNIDPVGSLAPAPGQLAPDDGGNPAQWHLYQKTENVTGVGLVTSNFVWVPVFTAYQIINPSACSLSSDPVGYWVANPPSSGNLSDLGTSDGDYAAETFGGFYAAEFEASHADAPQGSWSSTANVTTGGSSTMLKVQQFCVPWTNLGTYGCTDGSCGWDLAAKTCMLYDSHCHLMKDDEWTALAVWSMIRPQTVNGTNIGNTVYGANANTSVPSDVDNSAVTFLGDPTYPNYRALTGTGTDSAWPSGINLTTNTGTTTGVYDMNGNVFEWTDTIELGTPAGTGSYAVDDGSTGIAPPAQGTITALSTDPKLRRYGVPGSTTGSSTLLFGSDHLWIPTSQIIDKPLRGGYWAFGPNAGVWALYLGVARSYAGVDTGFRAALKF